MSEGTITVRERDLMYRMIISQLLHDGFHDSAALLSKFVQPVPDCPPSNRLEKVVKLGLRAEPARKPLTQYSETVAPAAAIDLDFDTEVQTNEPEAAMYETCYVTSHKAACRAAAWSTDGQLIATGSADASIKVLDIERMLAKSSTPAAIQAMENQQQSVESHPVIRTYYDHSDEINCLEFHPTSPVVISGSKDMTVKFFRYSKSTLKRAFHIIHEVEKIKAISVHPTGDFILVGTKHPTLRLYDVNSLQCFVSSNPQDQHKGTILSVKYSRMGNMYVTGSKDGDIKIWDGVSNRCINTFYKAHGGEPVCSVQFSKNGKYILSSGKDSLVRLWELSTSRTLITYTGAGSDKQRHRNNAVFNHTEDYVMFPDEKTTSLCCWDSRNAERNKLLALGHNGFVRTIVHSATGPGLLTCSDDFRARFWYYRGAE